jgi:prolyl-tRNA synthetase
MRTRLFLRTSEFLWQEGHTAHKNKKEATKEALQMLDIYQEFVEEVAAVSVLKGEKSANERFAGAVTTYSIEAMMLDKKALQAGTSHELGQNFSKAFDIQFSDENNELKYPYQTSWGVSTRLVGMIIMAHGDDKGLKLPPKLAPFQVVIVPIFSDNNSKDSVIKKVHEIYEELSKEFRVYLDERDELTPGYKFNEWEMKGVPLRIEIGPRDVESGSAVCVRRDIDKKKSSIPFESISDEVRVLLDDIQMQMLKKTETYRVENTIHTDSMEELIKTLNERSGFVTCYWSENSDDENRIKDLTKATLRCYLIDNDKIEKSVNEVSKDGRLAVFSKAY